MQTETIQELQTMFAQLMGSLRGKVTVNQEKGHDPVNHNKLTCPTSSPVPQTNRSDFAQSRIIFINQIPPPTFVGERSQALIWLRDHESDT